MWRESESFGAGRKTRQPMELRITPLIDIVFLLLIFFMLTSRFVAMEGITVDLPETRKAHNLPSQEVITLVVTRDGRVIYEGMKMSLDELRGLLLRKDRWIIHGPIMVNSDRGAEVQNLVYLLELLREIGARRVAVGTVQGKGE